MRDSPRIGNYVLTRTLGYGATGKVKLAINEETGEEVAIKIISKSTFDTKPGLQPKIQREIALMRLLDHPHILRLLDILESPRHLYIVVEYASNGELFNFLASHRFLREDIALRFFRQLIYGLDYLHSLGICHRDLKPENILLDEHLNVKIADFGFARYLKSDLAETSCGSPHYAAPEIVRGEKYDGRAADVWSCGVILFALLAVYFISHSRDIFHLTIRTSELFSIK
jgi:BR serine/threonine kinase